MSVSLKGIQPRRAALGLRQEDLAKKLFVNRATVGMWETGAALPRATLLPAIARELRCSIDELYHYPNDTGPEGACP